MQKVHIANGGDMTRHMRTPGDNSAPTIPAATKRAIDEWTAKEAK